MQVTDELDIESVLTYPKMIGTGGAQPHTHLLSVFLLQFMISGFPKVYG